MNAKSQTLADPIVQQAKFVELQEENENLDAMYEDVQAAKKELRDFGPTVQDAYVKMHQLDSFS